MVDTVRSLSALQSLLADNVIGDISAQDLRDFLVTSLMITDAQTVTTADVSAEIGKHYELTVSGITAERNFLLPVPSGNGDRIRVKLITDAHADYELVIKGAATVTINSGTEATEWSRLFIKDEVDEFRATSLTNWDVVNDGRIPCSAKMRQTTAQSLVSSTYTDIEFQVIDEEVGINCVLASDHMIIRRSGLYNIIVGVSTDDTDTDVSWYIGIDINNSGSIINSMTPVFRTISGLQQSSHAERFNSGDAVNAMTWLGATGNSTRVTNIGMQPALIVSEVLQ